jgi:cell division protein FtsL
MKITDQQYERQTSEAGSAVKEGAVSVLGWSQLLVMRNVLLLLLLSIVLVSALAVVNTSYNSRTVFYELQQLRSQANQLEVEWGQLKIEQSTFGLEGRIERKAMEELNMKLPDWSRITMVRYHE